MFRRIKLALFMLLFATIVRHASAQRSTIRGQDIEKDFARGFTDDELAAERKLLRDKSKTITWGFLPLIEYPRPRTLPDSEQLRAKLGDDKFRELQLSKMEAAVKRFVDANLKDRTFSGTVRIARKEPSGAMYTIYAKETSPAKDREHRAPYAVTLLWPAYLCQWQADSDRDFNVGEDADIVGKIEDLKEDGKTNTLFLKNVELAADPAKKNTP
jgi:hypothetical protein